MYQHIQDKLNIARNIVLVVPPQVHLLDINGAAHVFYEAKAFGANLNLQFTSLNTETEIASSAGLHFSKLTPFLEIETQVNDLICVPGIDFSLLSDDEFIRDCQPFFSWLRRQHELGTKICSICTGSFFLAEAGLLDGLMCTTHWKFCDRFVHKFPKAHLKKDRLFVANPQIYTSAGVASGIDLSLYILEEWYDSRFVADIAKEIVIFFRRSESDPQLSIFLQYKNHLENRIHQAQDFILGNLHQPFNVEHIAEAVSMSPRNLTRLFKKTIGITISQYIEKLRVEKAVQLLSDHATVSNVASQCGLKSPNQLRSLLKKHEGLLPTQIKTSS